MAKSSILTLNSSIGYMDGAHANMSGSYTDLIGAHANLNGTHKEFARKSLEASSQNGLPSPSPTTSGSQQNRSSVDSAASAASTSTSLTPSFHALPPLQTKGPIDEYDHLSPVLEDDPSNFDLLAAPSSQITGVYQMEKRGEQLMSESHLRLIFQDPKLLLRFTGFLSSHRPESIRTLIYYLDALKALRAIEYANAITEALEPLGELDFTREPIRATVNAGLQDRAHRAFEVLAREDLPAYVAYTWIQVVSVSIQRRITGTLAPHLREASEGLAEVFCLSDPSRPDNPIVFASEGMP